MFKIEVDDRHMHCIIQNFKNKCRGLNSLADLNIGHYVELTFLEGKLVKYLRLLEIILIINVKRTRNHCIVMNFGRK